MSIYTKHLNNFPSETPIPGRTMLKAASGAYTFEVSPSEMLKRFLILGTEGGTYYASEHKLTVENTTAVVEYIKKDGSNALRILLDVVNNRRAPKMDAAIFTMALIVTHASQSVKEDAYFVIPTLLKTGTHLFQFVNAVNDMRGWSRGLRRAVSVWYTSKKPEALAYQLLKYRSREGWTHKDVIRLAHPKTNKPAIAALLAYTAGKEVDVKTLPTIVGAFETIQKEKSSSLISESRLEREMLPTEYLNDVAVWKALLPHMKSTALIRNLATMTSKGVINNALEDTTQLVVEKLKSVDLHPVNTFIALRQYAKGTGLRGHQTWNPIDKIVTTLQDVYTKGLANVESSGKRILYAQDISGSMRSSVLGNNMSAVEVCAGIIHAMNAIEDSIQFCAFNTGVSEVRLSESASVLQLADSLNKQIGGGTDVCSPIKYAMARNMTVDAFVIATDSEQNEGQQHLIQVLNEYRKKYNKDAKLVLVALTATRNTIKDPLDKNAIEVVGFDSNVPELIVDFIKDLS